MSFRYLRISQGGEPFFQLVPGFACLTITCNPGLTKGVVLERTDAP